VNSRFLFRSASIIVFSVFLSAAAKNSSSQQQPDGQNLSTAKPAATEGEKGEKLFQTQCGRCHALPEDLSPREARAVIRQMRVRANLTAADERLILKYLAP
jgi:cytochrome c5